MLSVKPVICLVAGALLVPYLANVSSLVDQARAQGMVQKGALQNATEAQVKAQWEQLQKDSQSLEATDPRAAIARYGDFLEAGAARVPSVGLQISLRVARLWQLGLRDYEMALRTYDWALARYSNEPEAFRLQQGRINAQKAQDKADKAKERATKQEAAKTERIPAKAAENTKDLPPAKTPINKPLIVKAPSNLGIKLPFPSGGNMGVKSPPSGGSKLGIGAPQGGDALKLAVAAPEPPLMGDALGWQAGTDRCITALAQHSDGTIWVATEDSGVWRYDSNPAPGAGNWKQFTAKDGLADNNAYALAVDQKGRVWAGTLNHGVSVWNGQQWKNYGVLDGPLGERVFDIAICPTDGDVWIATNAGLTRYSQQKESWSYVTRADGLPSDQVQAIAFDKDGNIVLGTQCDGVALSQAADGYQTWRVEQGPEKMPLTATGAGLPSSLINDVLIGRDGTIYAATTTGLAWSSDKGANWSYIRGENYAAKVQGLYGGAPVGWKKQAGAVLAEDYVSCLAEDEAGQLWVGHWKKGSEMVGMQRGPSGLDAKEVAYRRASGFVKAMLPRDNGTLLLARYDQGLSYGSATVENEVLLQAAVVATTVSFPTAAKAPTLNELNTMLASLSKVEPLDSTKPFVTALTNDWTTQGDWLGRYGRYWASLNAMISPRNYYWGGGGPILHTFQISPKQKDDAIRYWVAQLSTDDPRALEMPPTYFDSRLQKGLTTKDKYRRLAELDDHGEEYLTTKEGLDIYFSVEIPKGLWTLSFYNSNTYGFSGPIRMRDYLYSIRGHVGGKPIDDVMGFDQQPELAKSRQRDFRNGVYQRFLVRGPQQLDIKIARNNSYNTILAGVFLDSVDEQPAPYFGTVEQWQERQNTRKQHMRELNAQNPAERAARFAPASDEREAATRLFTEVERLRDSNPLEWGKQSRPIYQALSRVIFPSQPEVKGRVNTILDSKSWLSILQSTSFYNLTLYNDWEELQRRRGLMPARDIEKALKWDGRSSDGEGSKVINQYLSSLPFLPHQVR